MEVNPLKSFGELHFLVVDDDPLIGCVTVEHYSSLGIDVEAVTNGAEALRRMEARLPDLVLCDRKMPEMSGAALLEEIRNRGPEWQRVAFIFVTSLADRRDRYAMMSLHPDGYIAKPVDFEKEDQVIAQVLRERRAKKEPPA